jgi:riboflavin kinase/FMN adenylyltransferase
VGTPPTFPAARDYVEAHLVGFDGDLVGSSLTLEFVERLRDQRRFDSPDALSQAIQADIRSAVHVIDDVLENGQIRDMEGAT